MVFKQGLKIRVFRQKFQTFKVFLGTNLFQLTNQTLFSLDCSEMEKFAERLAELLQSDEKLTWVMLPSIVELLGKYLAKFNSQFMSSVSFSHQNLVQDLNALIIILSWL